MEITFAINDFRVACENEISSGAADLDDICEDYIDHRANIIDIDDDEDHDQYLQGVREILVACREALGHGTSTLKSRLRDHYRLKIIQGLPEAINNKRMASATKRYKNARRNALDTVIGYIGEIDEAIGDSDSGAYSYSSSSSS
jgi:hypothetical protein